MPLIVLFTFSFRYSIAEQVLHVCIERLRNVVALSIAESWQL